MTIVDTFKVPLEPDPEILDASENLRTEKILTVRRCASSQLISVVTAVLAAAKTQHAQRHLDFSLHCRRQRRNTFWKISKISCFPAPSSSRNVEPFIQRQKTEKKTGFTNSRGNYQNESGILLTLTMAQYFKIGHKRPKISFS